MRPATSIAIVRGPILAMVLLLLGCACSQAHADTWQPAPGHEPMPLRPGKVSDALPDPKPQSVRANSPKVTNGSQPTMTL